MAAYPYYSQYFTAAAALAAIPKDRTIDRSLKNNIQQQIATKPQLSRNCNLIKTR